MKDCYTRLIDLEDVSQKSEDNLAMAESELDKQTGVVTDLTRKMDELQLRADEAVRLKDQLDECVSFALPFRTALTLQQVPPCSGQASEDRECHGEV